MFNCQHLGLKIQAWYFGRCHNLVENTNSSAGAKTGFNSPKNFFTSFQGMDSAEVDRLLKRQSLGMHCFTSDFISYSILKDDMPLWAMLTLSRWWLSGEISNKFPTPVTTLV